MCMEPITTAILVYAVYRSLAGKGGNSGPQPKPVRSAPEPKPTCGCRCTHRKKTSPSNRSKRRPGNEKE